MKQFILTLLLTIVANTVLAQNVQLHYDFGHALQAGQLSERPDVTTTAEMFRSDALGNTFFFIDLDYYSSGMAGAYWEVSREMNVSKNKRWAAHVEYDGGLTSNKALTHTTRFQQALLVGPAWNWHSADFSRTFSVQALYKYYLKGEMPYQRPFSGFQLTEVWGVTFASGLCTFSGFCDLWYDSKVDGNLILMSEPQFWFNLNTLKGWNDIHLSVGTEVEISNNFIWTDSGRNDRFFAIPTLACKWTF